MLVKGIVMSQMIQGSNKIKVRLPTFETAGIDNKVIIQALIAYNPGNLYSYNIGDVVIVSFEHDQVNQPIILGKLYTGPEDKASNYSFANSLEVTEKAVLPTTTTIGNLSYNDLVLAVNSAANSEVKADTTKNTTTITNNSSTGNNKTITMKYLNGYLTIKLHNFEETDVGKFIWLYKTGRHQRKGYRHPESLGYGNMANKWTGNYEDGETQIFPAVPSWMEKSVFETSWTLTKEMIETGYFVINLKYDWIGLAGYSFYEEDWFQIFGSSDCGLGESQDNVYKGVVRMKFGLVDTKKNLELLSSDTLLIGKSCADGLRGLPVYEMYTLTSACLNLEALYITIK